MPIEVGKMTNVWGLKLLVAFLSWAALGGRSVEIGGCCDIVTASAGGRRHQGGTEITVRPDSFEIDSPLGVVSYNYDTGKWDGTAPIPDWAREALQ